MRYLRFVLDLGLLFLVACVERAIGWPVLIVALISWGAGHQEVGRTQGWIRYARLVAISILLMALWTIPWLVTVIVVCAIDQWGEYGKQWVVSDTMRLMMTTIAGSLALIFLAPGEKNFWGIGYLIAVLVGIFIIRKRERLQPRQWRIR